MATCSAVPVAILRDARKRAPQDEVRWVSSAKLTHLHQVAFVKRSLSVGSIHYHSNVRRIRHDIIDGRPLLRLRNEGLDVFALGVGFNFVGYLDAAKAIADIV